MMYPENTVRIMRSQMMQLSRTIAHHYANRHDGRGSKCAKHWIEAYRKADAASGYSQALALLANKDTKNERL